MERSFGDSVRELTRRAALIVAIWINLNAGNEILAGLLSPGSPEAIAVSVARSQSPENSR